MVVDELRDGARAAPTEGTRVEVRRRFDHAWTRGFTVVAAMDDGYRVRRESDGTELPVVFSHEEIRREHKRSMWWI